MKKLMMIFVMMLLVTSCATLKNEEQVQDNNISNKNENTEKEYVFSKNVGKIYNEVMYYSLDSIWEKHRLGTSSVTYLENGYGYTTSHSVRFVGQILTAYFDKDSVDIEVVNIQNDINIDFAIVKFITIPKNVRNLETSDEIIIGNEATLSGFPKGKKEDRIVEILDYNHIKIILTKGVEGGMSGGLLFSKINNRNRVLGIITGYDYYTHNSIITRISKINIIIEDIKRQGDYVTLAN